MRKSNLRGSIHYIAIGLTLFALMLQACSQIQVRTAQSTATVTSLPSTATSLPSPTVIPTPTPLPEETPWWNGSVFYEIFVRSFYDSNGDGIGDFNGLTAKLDYLNDADPESQSALGVTGLWLMPIFPASSYHGYDVLDYRSVNPDYGTMEDFKKFLSAAHQHGIRVILDFPINHTSIDHPWFKASQKEDPKYKDWYIWSKTDPGYLGPWGEEVWHKDMISDRYYYGVFDTGMPDLNFENQAVTQEIDSIINFWLKDIGVDGFRVDGAKHLIEEGQKQENTNSTHQWLKGFYQAYKTANPDAMAVGEVWSTSFEIIRYINDKNFDLVFDFDGANGVMKAITSGSGSNLSNGTNFEYKLFPSGGAATFLTNHDQNRVMSQFGNDERKARLAAVTLLSMPGVPFLYYGEEIGMTGSKPDEQIRTPMQWDSTTRSGFTLGNKAWYAVNSDYEKKNVALQSSDPQSLLSLYRKLISLRRTQPALRFGELLKVDAGNPGLFAAVRNYKGQAVLVVLNLSDQPVRDYGLSLKNGLQSGDYALQGLLAAGDFSKLSVGADGGFSGFKPQAEIPAFGYNLYQLVAP